MVAVKITFTNHALTLTLLITLASGFALPAQSAADETLPVSADETLPDVTKRFANSDVDEQPSFQKHVVPTLSRLGCNGRACHGSFQGRGGFRLSLFGYDFAADHAALMEQDSDRVNREFPDESLMIAKPTGVEDHEGGKRYNEGGWEHHLIRKWIAEGAKKEPPAKLAGLEVTPSEIMFDGDNQTKNLKAIAVWQNGSREDVTPLCRFQSNDTQIATIDNNGKVTSGKAGDSHVVVFYDKAVVPVSVIQPVSQKYGVNYPQVSAPTRVDKLVVDKLRKTGLVQSATCDDATFLRRVSLDITGTLPSPSEIESFLADDSSDKRSKKIDELLQSPAYAAWWTTKLCDFTGNTPRELNNVGLNQFSASNQWYKWIYERVNENAPYDELVEGIVTAVSRESGESYYDYCTEMSEVSRDNSGQKFAQRDSMPYYWMRRQFRDGPSRAISFAHSFLGIRIQCAQCHKHPFDQWTKNDFKLFAQMFTAVNTVSAERVPESKNDYNKIIEELGLKGKRINGMVRQQIQKQLREGKTIPFQQLVVTSSRPVERRNRNRRNRNRDNRLFGSILGGEKLDVRKLKDPRDEVMQWLRDPDNPYFAKAFVNRVWATYFNVGIVTPTDDLNLANPPSNGPLLDYLATGFIEHDYDMKWLHREIANSRTYQLSWKPNETNRTDQRNFSRAVPRRLPAEVVFDNIILATANDEKMEKAKDELLDRTIAGRSAVYRNRNKNRNNRNQLRINPGFALAIFGASPRQNSCDCDRSMDPSLLQTVYLQNDYDIHKLINRQQNGWLAQIVEKYAPTDADGNKMSARELQKFGQQYQNLRQRRDQLAKQEGKEKKVERLKKQMRELQIRHAKLRKKFQAAQKSAVSDADLQHIIQQAYLRTLSRPPAEDEMVRCIEYVKEDPNKLNALKGVLWALINTKEFIVNH
jgi:hypothetical protein